MEMVDAVDDFQPPWFLTFWKVKNAGWGPKMAKIQNGVKPDIFKCAENCISTEQSHPWYPIQKEGSIWRNKIPRKRIVSFMEDRSLT